MKKKKLVPVLIILTVVILVVAAVIFFVGKGKRKTSDEIVYVESVADITGLGFYGVDRYMGVVESQETKGVDKAADKTVKEIFVEVGDTVKEGDLLFEYDTEEMNLKLKQLELELSSINNSITNTNQQIATLSKEKEQVPAEEKLEYTSQIANLQAQINQLNYDASDKQLEIDRQKTAIENSVVFSPMDGVVKEINKDSTGSTGEDDYYYGYNSGNSESHYISIMALGDYRIKGTANEMTVHSMYEGQSVIIRSRIDENVTWRGNITLIDLEHPDSGENNYYYPDTGANATKYPFYIELETIDNLILGQHVYVEMDYGQGEVKDGLWLGEYYIVQENGEAYVWAADKDDRIEKRKVTLGAYDEDLMEYEILSGLDTSDYIAFPEDRLKEGMRTTQDMAEVMPDMGGDGMMFDDGMMYDEDGMMFDDGMMYDEDGMMFDDGMMYDEDGMMFDDGMIDGEMIDDGIIDGNMGDDGVTDGETSDFEEGEVE